MTEAADGSGVGAVSLRPCPLCGATFEKVQKMGEIEGMTLAAEMIQRGGFTMEAMSALVAEIKAKQAALQRELGKAP